MECQYAAQKECEKAIGIESKILQGKSWEEEIDTYLEENFRGCQVPDPGWHEEEFQGSKDNLRFQV